MNWFELQGGWNGDPIGALNAVSTGLLDGSSVCSSPPLTPTSTSSAMSTDDNEFSDSLVELALSFRGEWCGYFI